MPATIFYIYFYVYCLRDRTNNTDIGTGPHRTKYS